MKANKKTIAIIIATLVLVVAATTGVVMYLNDDGTSRAGFEENEPSISNVNTNTGTEENNNQGENAGNTENTANPESPANNEPGNLPEAGENANNANQGTTANRGTGTTTTTNNANVPNQEYVTERIEEVERQITEDLLVGWTPLNINSEYSTNGLGIYKPDLKIVKVSSTTDGNNSVVAGDALTYAMAVKNDGNEDITGLTISDVIPEQTTFIEGTIYGNGTYNKELNKIVWKVDVKAGEVVAVGFAVTVNDNATGTIKNVGTVDGKDTEEVLNPIITSEKLAQLYKNDEPVEGLANIGDKIKYTVVARNTGDADATVVMKDTIPANTELVSAIKIADEQIDEATMNAGKTVTVPAGKTVELTFTVEVKSIDGSIKNIATVGNTKPDIEVKTANLEIAKTVSNKIDGEYGENVTLKLGEIAYFKIELKNTGSEELDVTMQDLMNGTDIQLFDGETEIKETVKVLAGETKTLTATYKMTQTDIDNQETLKNVAIATTPVTPGIEDSAEITPEKAKPEIKVEKIATKVNGEDITDGTKVSAGDKVTYTITVTNIGNVTLHNVVVTDDLVSSFNKTIENLAPNASETYTVEYEVTQADVDNKAKIVNTATATDGTTTGKDTDETVPTDKTPGIAVEKTATKVNGKDITENTKVRAGDVITYTITVTNTGKITLKDVQVIDKTLNVNYNGTEIVAESPIDTISSLAPNASKPYTVTYTVTENDIANKAQIENTAIATDGTTTDEKPSNPVPVNPNVSLTVIKHWNDSNNQDGYRPTSITIKVKDEQNNIVGTEGLDGDLTTNDWTKVLFNDLPKYKEGKQINYTIIEEITTNVDKYTASEPKITVDSSTGNITAEITNTYVKPTLTITKTSNVKAEVKLGDEITYTIKAKNIGKVTAKSVIITDAIPANTTLKEGTISDNGENNNGTITWNIASLAVGEPKSVSFTVIVNNSADVIGKTITNTGYVNGDPTNETTTTVSKTIAITKKEYPVKAIDVVLVLDVSSSMNDFSRIDNAKKATCSFIDEMFPTGTNKTGSTVTVVTFGNNAITLGKATNAKEANTLKETINDIKIPDSVGTNVQEALKHTNNVLNNLKNTNKFVVFLGDGEPTPSYVIAQGDSGSEWYTPSGFSANTESNIRDEANNIKSKTTGVYTIGFGMDKLSDEREYWSHYTECTVWNCQDPKHVTVNAGDENRGKSYHWESEKTYATRILRDIIADTATNEKQYYYTATDSAESIVKTFMNVLTSISTTTSTVKAESKTVKIPVTGGTVNTTRNIVIKIGGEAFECKISELPKYGVSYAKTSSEEYFTWDLTEYAMENLEIEYTIK